MIIKLKINKSYAKNNNIKLLSIFPDDIKYRNYDQLYEMLVKKIKSFEDELDGLFEYDDEEKE